MANGSRDVSAIYEILYNPNYTPRASAKAHIDGLTIDGKATYILARESDREYFEVDSTTRAIWDLLDGRKTLREVYEALKGTEKDLTEKDVKDVVVSLAEEGIIESTEPVVPKKRVEIVSAFQINVQLLRNTSESLAGFFRLTRGLVRKSELPLSLGITAVAFVLFYADFIRIFSNPSILDVAGSALLGFFFYQMIVLLPVYAIHELAHAAMCDYYGGKPGEIGTGLYYLAPFFYCDTSDAWRLSRRARIMISVAGPVSTLIISALFVFWAYLMPPGYPKDVLEISAFFGFYGTLTNFSPVIETDGYYILADVLNIPNLRDEAFGYIKRLFFTIFRRPVAAPRQSTRHRRIIAIYSVITVAWLAFFGYTTAWLFGIYGVDAYMALTSLLSYLLGLKPLDLTGIAVNFATLAYFGLIVSGFAVMGAVAYRNVRMKGVKLETIHDKRGSILLPLPSDIDRARAGRLVKDAQKLARGIARSSAVTLQPPLCVADLKLGRVDQSLDAMWDELRKVEGSFRSLHRRFIGEYISQKNPAMKSEKLAESLRRLVQQFPDTEKGRGISSVRQLIRSEDERIGKILQAAFGAIWTFELSPVDYKRLGRGMLSNLLADDLSLTDLPAEVEDYKKRTVLGFSAIAKLSTEIESELREVRNRPEVFQTTAFLEPVKGRLVFIGRTDKVEGTISWLGGLYLYQSWTSSIEETLEEATLGLRSIRLSQPASLTKSKVGKMDDTELHLLKESLDSAGALNELVPGAIAKVESTYESAKNFHENLVGLVEEESFDIGLYKPILAANEEHLQGVGSKTKELSNEFEKISRGLRLSREEVGEELSRRASTGAIRRASLRESIGKFFSYLTGGAKKPPTQAFDSQTKLIFAVTRQLYGVVAESEIIA